MKGFIEVTTGNNAYKALVQVNTIQTVIEEGSVVHASIFTGTLDHGERNTSKLTNLTPRF